MKLLIITQKIDKNDDILGFFHEWVKRLALEVDFLNIICLEKGEYNLPDNVKIFSLGKENEKSRIKYVLNFYSYIWNLRKDYDIVFVHMNSEYVVMGKWLWKFLKKKIFLWYNHKQGGKMAEKAIKSSEKVFYTSQFAFSAKFKNSVEMPAGINIDKFNINSSIQRIRNSILSLGRISLVKNVNILIDALNAVNRNNIEFNAGIYGNPTDKDNDYYKKIRETAKKLEENGKLIFYEGISNYKTPDIYNQYEIFINMTPSGSFDKTILESIACGCIPVFCNKSFNKILPERIISMLLFNENNPDDLAYRIIKILELPEIKRKEIQRFLWERVVVKHNLNKLIKDLISELSK